MHIPIHCAALKKTLENLKIKYMNLNTIIIKLILIGSLLISSKLNAQEVSWDKFDVVDGTNPTLRYGFYTESNGKIQMGRYYFIDDGVNLRVRLAPFGKTATELPVRGFNRTEGILELGWEGKPNCICKLVKQNEFLYLGNCIENENVMPIAIRVVNEYDEEWTGFNFPVSEIDIQILKKAKEILLLQDYRNLNGDRICDDDIATGNFSLFCSLYYASIEVDGIYRHRRPAMRLAREEAVRRYPNKYIHELRDINNNPNITKQELVDIIDSAILMLTEELNSIFNKK